MQRFDIIDFHVPPFIKNENNLCQHYLDYDMNMSDSRKIFEALWLKNLRLSWFLSRYFEKRENLVVFDEDLKRRSVSA